MSPSELPLDDVDARCDVCGALGAHPATGLCRRCAGELAEEIDALPGFRRWTS